MKISDLSRQTGVSVETIKFYVREGLIPPGQSLRANKTAYTEAHAQRLKLIQALRDVGGLSVAATRRILDAFDQWSDDPRVAFHLAFDALSPLAAKDHEPAAGDAAVADLHRGVDHMLAEVGLDFGERSPTAEHELVDAIMKVRDYLYPDLDAVELAPLASAVKALTEIEMHWRPLRRETTVEELQLTVLKTVLFERVLVAMRRLARESLRDHILQAQGRITRPGAALPPTPSAPPVDVSPIPRAD